MNSFQEMGVCPDILKAIQELGFENPMPVQEQTIPLLLSTPQDIIALAQTGTGKTAAFGIPIIQNLQTKDKHTQALILSPTRELCMQIANDLKNFMKYVNHATVVAVYGGASIENQKKELQKGAHIIVATPGRLWDLIQRKYVNLSQVNTVVLDEADEMLDMGFKEDLDQILGVTSDEKNTWLFSATMSQEVNKIAKDFMHKPVEITIGVKNASSDNVIHQYYLVNNKNKYDALRRIADIYPSLYAIVFCRTKIETQEVAMTLMKDGYHADSLHGDLSQAQRDHVMNKFRCKNIQMLVATDVAARGLDVNNLTHVIHYNLPSELEQYTHRSGRTGRAHNKGISISIITPSELSKLRKLEQQIRKTIEWEKVPTGVEICEKQLYHMVHKMENVDVNYTEIEKFLPEIHKKLAWMDKEELIRRFVSVEFNQFLETYRNALDINAEPAPKRNKKDLQMPKTGNASHGMTKLYFGLGYRDRVVPQRLIQLINDYARNRDIYIGKIDIFDTHSFVEIDSPHAPQVVEAMNDVVYKGMDVIVEYAGGTKKDYKKRDNEKSGHSYSKDYQKTNRQKGRNPSKQKASEKKDFASMMQSLDKPKKRKK